MTLQGFDCGLKAGRRTGKVENIETKLVGLALWAGKRIHRWWLRYRFVRILKHNLQRRLPEEGWVYKFSSVLGWPRLQNALERSFIIPLADASNWFSVFVPSRRCSNRTHWGVSQLCNSVFSGHFPYSISQATRWARKLVLPIWNFPYPFTFLAASQKWQPSVLWTFSKKRSGIGLYRMTELSFYQNPPEVQA